MNQPIPRPRRRRNSKAGWLMLLAVGAAVIADTRLSPIGSKLRLLVLVLLPLVFLAYPNSGRTVRRASGTGLGLALIVVVGLVSSMASVAPVLGYLKLGFFVAVVLPLVTNRAAQEAFWPGTRTYTWFSRGMNCIILLCLAQTVGAFGFVNNPNKLAAFALMCLPWKLFESTVDRRRSRLRASLVIVVLFGICLATHSRGALGGFLITLIVFHYSGPARSILQPIIVGATLLVGFGLAVEMSPQLREFAYKDRESLLDNRRQTMVQDTMENFREQPVLGYGFGLSWKVRAEHVEPALRTGRLSWYVGEFGNSTLAIMAGGGSLLLFAFGFYFLAVLRFIEGSFKNVCAQGDELRLQRCLFASVVGLLAYSQVEGWMLSPLNWISVFFWLYVGMAIRLASGPTRHARDPILQRMALEKPGEFLAKAQRIAETEKAESAVEKN